MMDNKELKNLLKGGKILDVDFKEFGYGLKRIVVVSPEGKMLILSVEFESEFRSGADAWIEVQDVKTLERLA